jgi:acyl-CoA thioester hydrolase
MEKLDNQLEFASKLRVRYAEIDGMGIVYNGNYLTFFEVGRVELMRHFDLVYAELEKSGYHMPLIESHLKYHKPAKYDDEIEIRVKTDFSGGVKFIFNYEIWHNDEKLTTGSTVHVFTTIKTGKPVRPPKVFMEKWYRAIEK